MKRFTRTLRFRLTAWYCAALALGLLVSGLVLSGIAERSMLLNHDRDLRARGVRAIRILDAPAQGWRLSAAQEAELAGLGRVAFLRKLGNLDVVAYQSPEVAGSPIFDRLEVFPWEDARSGSFGTFVEGGDYWRVLTLVHRPPGGEPGVIWVVENLGDVEGTLHRLKVAFLHLAPLGLIVSCLGGLILSNGALAPVARIITLTKKIEASRLDQRLPHPGVDDEIGRLVDTLNRMIARLEASFAAVNRFTADASHELRSPLATIRNTIDLALERPRTADEQTAALASIGEDIDRIRSLVEDLLLLARADSGRLNLQAGPVRLGEIVEAQVDAHQAQAQDRAIDLRLLRRVDDLLPGDERWLHQVVCNLLDNALKYTPEGGAVSVDMQRLDSAVRCTVRDTGPGIQEGDLDRVFERFFRSDPSRSRTNVPGLGLGLSIAAWVVGEHRGSIRAENGA
ncbi:MAG TPA: ATP-binding protein, partial [Holophagaceae bacterium]